MSLESIGPVTVHVRRPAFSWTSAPTSHGHREFRVGGVVQWEQAQQLSELLANPALQRTIGNATGVLEYLVFTDELLGMFTGYYLLASFNLDAAHEWSGHGLNYPVAFSLDGVFLGAAA